MRYLIFLSMLVTAFIAHAQVTIQINEKLLDFSENPRLTEVLSKVAEDKQWYWPASSLYRLDSTRPEQQRNEVIAKLEFLQLALDEGRSSQVTYLIKQIKTWSLADRVDIKLDYDAAQMNANNNPRFENGKYRLDLRLRPTTADVFGISKQTLSINLAENQCVHHYIHQNVPQLANKDFIYLIQPNGSTQKVGIAYWNKTCVEVMPGSQLYLPLPESQFFNNNRMLNEQIIELAKNRIVP